MTMTSCLDAELSLEVPEVVCSAADSAERSRVPLGASFNCQLGSPNFSEPPRPRESNPESSLACDVHTRSSSALSITSSRKYLCDSVRGVAKICVSRIEARF